MVIFFGGVFMGASKMCRSCGSTLSSVDYRHGEILCRGCGLVMGDIAVSSVSRGDFEGVLEGRKVKVVSFYTDI